MLQKGKKAPAFRLPRSGGGAVASKDLLGKWVVLYFYPRDMTPGCTTEARDFRDASAAFAARDAVVLGVSKDSVARHEKFVEKEALPFDLLSDEDGATIEAFGAWGEKNMYGKKAMGIVRTTVLIDPAGKVAEVFANVRVKGHVERVLAALDALQRA
ncbi:MAG: thioredoxin-dependent thiol peroxidase [Sandaracinaceae bacterium]|nr:thioredoxin-dependent thiol peroxidase [Sandaracinaceae bacterium]